MSPSNAWWVTLEKIVAIAILRVSLTPSALTVRNRRVASTGEPVGMAPVAVKTAMKANCASWKRMNVVAIRVKMAASAEMSSKDIYVIVLEQVRISVIDAIF